MKKIIIILLVALAAVLVVQDFLKSKKAHTPVKPRPYVVLISFDGFRHDYAQQAETPWLDTMAHHGVKADALIPVFPTQTFPNHYSIVTGLYPQQHGIVANRFYAADIKQTFLHKSAEGITNGRFFKGEPIWVTAESQRVKTATFFWVGSEARIKGYQPTYYKPYDHNFPYKQRIDTLIGWLNKPYGQRPHLLTCYFDLTDTDGHLYGPDSSRMQASVQQLDSLLGYFMQQLKTLSLADSVNLMVVSDHGMATTLKTHEITLEKWIKPQWVDTTYGAGAFMMLQPAKRCADSIMLALAKVQGMSVFEKGALPAQWHYNQSDRISDLVLVANAPYWLTYKGNGEYSIGEHGFAPENTNMHGIFYASGPAFKAGYNPGLLHNIDLYALMCRILELQPAPNHGDTTRIYSVLK